MPTTPINGLRFPALSDNANVPLYLSNLASDVDGKLEAKVANPAARLALTGTYAGMAVYEQSTGRWYRRNAANSGWDYAGGAPPPVVACTVGTGWSAFPGIPPGVFQDASGLIHLVGAMTPNSSYNPQPPAGAAGALTIPTAFCPASSRFVNFNADNAFVAARIDPDGKLNIVGGTTSLIGSGIGHFLETATPYHPTYDQTLPFT